MCRLVFRYCNNYRNLARQVFEVAFLELQIAEDLGFHLKKLAELGVGSLPISICPDTGLDPFAASFKLQTSVYFGFK